MEKKYCNKEWLRIKYCEEKLSISAIAEECNTGLTTISRWLAKFEIRKIKSYKGDHKGPKNPYWRGGKYKDAHSGYILAHAPEHPRSSKKGYVREHRLVAEKFIGRHLRPNEIIHHKNKIKNDNRIENLEIIVLGEPNYGKLICPFCDREFKAG